MAAFRKPKQSLSDTLAAKAGDLHQKAADHHKAYEAHTQAAARASETADEAFSHALAVERAQAILDEAGVTL